MAESQSPTFIELGVAAETCDALANGGITCTFAIQELTLPLAFDDTDIISQACTGVGKTLGLGVPPIDRVFDDARIPESDGAARAITIAPTRELYVQVGEDLARATHSTNLRVRTIYGGRPYGERIEQLNCGVDTVVGTPGCLIDLYQRNNLELSSVRILVLDGADEILNLGFLPDIEKILAAVPDERQAMLFSAAMPDPILILARTFMNCPVHIRAESGEEEATVHEAARQIVFQSHQMDKVPAIACILQANGRGRTIILAHTERGAAPAAEQFGKYGFPVTAIHGDVGQPTHKRSLAVFRNGDVDVLVVTDVAVRGIDVDDVTHVINYQVPDGEITCAHRTGRTDRVGHSGITVTLVGWDETTKWKAIFDILDLDMAKIPMRLSTSPEPVGVLDFSEGTDEKVGPARPVLGSRPPHGRGGRGLRNNCSQFHCRNCGQGQSSG